MNDYKNIQTPVNGNGNPFRYAGIPEEEIHLRDYLRVFAKGKWIILVSFFIIFSITAVYTFTANPVYEATVRLMLQEQSNVGESLFDFTSIMKKETMMNNQVEILDSRTLAENVIRDLLNEPEAADFEVLHNDVYEKRNAAFAFIKNVFQSGKDEEMTAEDIFDKQVENLREMLNVHPIRNTDMIEIKVEATNPEEAATIANTVSEAYARVNREDSRSEAREVKNFLNEQLTEYENDLRNSEDQLKAYQETAGVVALDEETSELVRTIAEFEALYNEAKTDLQAAYERLAYIDQELDAQHKNIDIEAISSEPYLEELKKRIAEKEAQLAMYLSTTIKDDESRYTQREIKTLENNINALKEQFKREVSKIAASEFVDPARVAGSLFASKIDVETEIQALKPKVRAFEQILQQYNLELESLPEKKLQLARLERQAQVSEKIYIMLQEKYQESRISEVGQLGNVRVVDPAKPPNKTVKPRKKLNLILGALLGLGLGIGIAFVREYMDNSINSLEDVEALGAPLISIIPFIQPQETNGFNRISRKNLDPDVLNINERLVTHLKPKSPASEAYRSMRTNLLFSSADHPRQLIMVTSSTPREGKSTSVANLAITFAQMGSKTLLVDADLRRPMLHKLFSLPKEPGLTNIIAGKAEWREAIQNIEHMQNIDVLPCGTIPPNPAELLGSESMHSFLKDVRNHYDIVLLDSPPVIAVTDPALLSTLMDSVLLVVKAGDSELDAVSMAITQLKRIEAPVTGIVLNSVKKSNFYSSRYYYKYYDYYHTNGKKKSHKRKAKRISNKT